MHDAGTLKITDVIQFDLLASSSSSSLMSVSSAAEAFVRRTDSTKKFRILDQLELLTGDLYTHIVFSQWVNSGWNKELQLIGVKQHTPVHEVTEGKQRVDCMQKDIL